MKLLVLQPSRSSVSVDQRTMMLHLASELRRVGGHLAFVDETTPGLLGHSRALLLSRLARYKCHRGLWLDADTTLDPARIVAMAQRDEEVIAWNYPVRLSFDIDHPPEKMRATAEAVRNMPMRPWTGTPRLGPTGGVVRSEDGVLIELLQCGFGAALMAPAAAQRMLDKYGTTTDWDHHSISLAFDPWPQPHPRSSEDISFWRRFVKAGGRLWCDPEPYVTNGQSGGRFADEIARAEEIGSALTMQARIF